MANTYELTIQSGSKQESWVEVVFCLLISLNIPAEKIAELTQWGKKNLCVFLDDKAKVLTIKSKIRSLKIKTLKMRIRTLKEDDWLTKWKREFKPFMLTDNIKIIPAWLKGEHRTNKMPIYIDTGLAFGTGLHATTRYMAAFVERCESTYISFLDIGTGTGILAIIAAKLGSQQVDAIDISRDAIDVARENFETNAVKANRLKAINFEQFKATQKYAFVAANLITHDLLKFKSKIINMVDKGGHLAVSGISIHNYALFREKFKTNKLKCLKIEKGEGWAAVLFKKVS